MADEGKSANSAKRRRKAACLMISELFDGTEDSLHERALTSFRPTRASEFVDLFVEDILIPESDTKSIETVFANYANKEFSDLFRITRSTFECACKEVNLIIGNKPSPRGRPVIPFEKQMMLAIYYLGHMESIRQLAIRFEVAESTAWSAIQKVIDALNSLYTRVVRWPDKSTLSEMADGFKATTGFPSVAGILSCSHIRIKAPLEDPTYYYNHKKFYSVILQAVCDQNMRFTDCFVGWCGSVQESEVLRNCPLHCKIQENEQAVFPNDSHLLAYHNYPLKPWLLTPYQNDGYLSNEQSNYNSILCEARSKIDQTFALLKGRFQRLKYVDMTKVELVPKMVIACCVVHNMAIDKGDISEFRMQSEIRPLDQATVMEVREEECLIAIAKREKIVEFLVEDVS